MFIHDAILESVTCGDTQISATNLRMATTKMKNTDIFKYQMKVSDTKGIGEVWWLRKTLS